MLQLAQIEVKTCKRNVCVCVCVYVSVRGSANAHSRERYVSPYTLYVLFLYRICMIYG